MAVPQTVTYDISKRNTAKNEVEDILTNKEDALTKEKAFYDVLEQYLESFPSVEETDNLKREDKEEAEQLRNRFETDFVETFIDSPVLALAGFDDATTKIYEIFESLQADLSQRNTENVDNYLQTVPTRFENEVTKEEIPKQGTHPDDISLLLDILELECENITTRWHLWKRISNISQETTDPPLDATVARDIRRALRDVVLDSEQSYLDAVVVDQTIEERYENKDDEYAEKQEACEEAETAYDEVAGDLEELIADWRDRDEVRDAADELAAITKYEDTVNSAINDLATYLSTKANAVESDDPQEVQNTTLQLSTVGPLDDFEGRGLRNLNEKLDDMGVAQIDRNQLEAEFAIVKDARELHLEHGGWL
ncbi:hypothetical protein, partial [Halovenus aranensis]|uniref:hypothetical protein n=1 Tax=Halovenus aranensis TaxID=890420 RepID=UPI00117A582D